jgi:16S rRNA (uracil1498-N3)-methyltransferase
MPSTNFPAGVASAAHALVDVAALVGASSGFVELSDQTHRHFHRVLRLRSGQLVTATDGSGSWCVTRVPTNFADSGALEVDGEVVRTARPDPWIGIGVALPKGDKPELVVQKLSELGVDEIVFFAGDNSVAKWDESKVRKNFERLRLVSIEAIQQSRGVFLPAIRWVPTLAELVQSEEQGVEQGVEQGFTGTPVASSSTVFRADVGGSEPELAERQVVVIGPEGGWSPAERELGRSVSLASTVLRAETAAVVAAAFWVGMRSGHVGPST